MTKQHRLLITIFVFAVVGLFHGAVLAETTTGTLFKIENPSTTTPTSSTTSSPSYSLEANVGAIINSGSSSPSFVVSASQTQTTTFDVAPTPPSPTPPPSGGGGPGISGSGSGGGSVAAPAPATLSNDTSCPLYRSSVLLRGGKASDATAVEINGSSLGVIYPTTITWQKPHTLIVGNNDVSFRSIVGSTQGTLGTARLQRRLPGDVNGDTRVDDFDLSLIASHWGQQWCVGDFNADGKIDDFDLSILVSGWKTQ